MAYNIPNNYKDTTPAKPLDKATLNKMVWRSLNLQGSFNMERMQANGWLYSILPGLEKIHGNKDDLAASMSHNLEFFNTHPFLVTFVMGIVLSLEQNKADIPTIRAVRVAAMGPLGGIGDAIFWLTLVPITAGITANMALQGNILAPILFLLIFNAVQFGIRFWLMNWSYNLGTSAIGILTANAREFTRAASILGVFVVGTLTVLYGGTNLGGFVINNGTTQAQTEHVEYVTQAEKSDMEAFIAKLQEVPGNENASVSETPSGLVKATYYTYEEAPVSINIQKDVLDTIIPKFVPLVLTLGLYYLFAFKGWTPMKAIIFLLILGLIGAGPFGWWPSIWG